MSSTGRDNETLTAAPDTAPHSVGKPQPVALEIAVTVNGARTVEGGDKREPFSESTLTVLVFSNGAVIRLSSAVSPGQLLFLSNDKTKKEVVCQVVKSKSYRSVSGYVELEFTEPVAGFWGMRFPGERTGPLPSVPVPAQPSSPAMPPVPTAGPPVQHVVPPSASKTEVSAVQKPVAPVVHVASVPVKPVAPSASLSDPPHAPHLPAPTVLPKSPTLPAAIDTSLMRAPEIKPVTPQAAKLPTAPLASASGSEALKLEAARLQDQLSHLLFTDAPPVKPTHSQPATPVFGKAPAAEAPSKVLELPKTPPSPPPAVPSQSLMSFPLSSKPVRRAEPAKIPAWLEPLPQSAVVSSPSAPEQVVNDEAQHLLERGHSEEVAGEFTVADEDQSSSEVPAPAFGAFEATEESDYSEEASSGGSKKGILIWAIAAGVLLLVGGGFLYFRRQSSGVHAAVTASAPQPSAIPETNSQSQPQSNTPSQTNPPQANPPQANPSQSPAVVSSALSSNPLGAVIQAREKTLVPVVRPPEPAQAPPKKSSLGEVRLAAPTVNRRSRVQDPNDSDLGLTLNGPQPEANEGSLGAGFAANSILSAAPTAPLPIGGDVKPAKLLSSIPPAYPSLAKTQHVSGDVRLDALIDAAGRVTTMKVVSGPTLLHQAAMDALRQWKYQPASLDGKAVPMHLTVTIQFRLK